MFRQQIEKYSDRFAEEPCEFAILVDVESNTWLVNFKNEISTFLQSNNLQIIY